MLQFLCTNIKLMSSKHAQQGDLNDYSDDSNSVDSMDQDDEWGADDPYKICTKRKESVYNIYSIIEYTILELEKDFTHDFQSDFVRFYPCSGTKSEVDNNENMCIKNKNMKNIVTVFQHGTSRLSWKGYQDIENHARYNMIWDEYNITHLTSLHYMIHHGNNLSTVI